MFLLKSPFLLIWSDIIHARLAEFSPEQTNIMREKIKSNIFHVFSFRNKIFNKASEVSWRSLKIQKQGIKKFGLYIVVF